MSADNEALVASLVELTPAAFQDVLARVSAAAEKSAHAERTAYLRAGDARRAEERQAEERRAEAVRRGIAEARRTAEQRARQAASEAARPQKVRLARDSHLGRRGEERTVEPILALTMVDLGLAEYVTPPAGVRVLISEERRRELADVDSDRIAALRRSSQRTG